MSPAGLEVGEVGLDVENHCRNSRSEPDLRQVCPDVKDQKSPETGNSLTSRGCDTWQLCTQKSQGQDIFL